MTSNSVRKCLACYEPLKADENYYHLRCSRSLFSKPPTVVAPLDIGLQDIEKLAQQVVNQRLVLTGVQPKLSLGFKKPAKADPVSQRLTIVGWDSNFILKPPHQDYPELPEIEDLCMHLAEIAKINTARHGLIPLKTGELAYVSKRFDRAKKKQKLAVEDLCQLMGFLTQNKYSGSMEQVGKTIRRYSSNPGIDAIAFFDLSVFCFLIGNADMHLKNFSMLSEQNGFISLSPAYDLVSTQLAMPSDKEELALPLGGKKSKLTLKHFKDLGETLQLTDKIIGKSLERLQTSLPLMLDFIKLSFLSKEKQKEFIAIIKEHAARLNLRNPSTG